MIEELSTGDFTIFTVKKRVATNNYTARKVQKDRNKLKLWLNTLLNDRQVIIFYNDNNQEHMIVGTLKPGLKYERFPSFPEVEPTIEIVNGKEVEEIQYCFFYEHPSRTACALHLDNITKFIVATEGIGNLKPKK